VAGKSAEKVSVRCRCCRRYPGTRGSAPALSLIPSPAIRMNRQKCLFYLGENSTRSAPSFSPVRATGGRPTPLLADDLEIDHALVVRNFTLVEDRIAATWIARANRHPAAAGHGLELLVERIAPDQRHGTAGSQ